MTFFRKLIFIISILFISSIAFADNHDTKKNIVEKAKEINKKIKKQEHGKRIRVPNLEPITSYLFLRFFGSAF